MKVYSWKTLLVTILAGAGGIIFSVYGIMQKEILSFFWLALFVYYVRKGLLAALTEEGNRRDMEDADRGKRIYRKLFGKFARIAPYGALLCFLAALVVVRLFPDMVWMGMCFIFAAPVYQFWLTRLVRREMDEEDI